MKPRYANLLLLGAGAIWGLGFVAQRTAMEDVGPMLFIGMRFCLAAAVVAPFGIRECRARSSWNQVFNRRFLLLGTVFFCAMALQQVGLLGTTVTNAGFLTTLYVVIVPLIMSAFGMRQPRLIWICAACSLLGVFLLSNGLKQVGWGDGLIIACAVAWAVHVVLIGNVAQQNSVPVTMACVQFAVCGILGIAAYLVCAALGIERSDLSLESIQPALPEILYAGICSGGIAFTFQAIGQRYTTASVAAILMASESLFAAVLGAIILGESLKWSGYVGCSLIFVSIVSIELLRIYNSGKRLEIAA